MNPNKIRIFLFGLAVTFGAPWLLLVIVPFANLQALQQVPFNEDADGRTGLFPGKLGAANGVEVYRAEGCANCHTQLVRPTYAGVDGWKKNWQIPGVEGPVRYSLPHDYIGQDYALLGNSRMGPDLANVGYRRDEQWLYDHLYDPRIVAPWSNMPSYRHLFEVGEVGGQPSKFAVRFPDGAGLPDGYGSVPSAKAKSLVAYLLSLKQEQDVPLSIGAGATKPVAEIAAPAPEGAAPSGEAAPAAN